MGMFDDLKCRYPLPHPGANDLLYQTKDTDAQFLDNYEIREDGTIWHEVYEVEDQSDRAKWKAAHPGEDTPKEMDATWSWMGSLTHVNKRWEQVKMTGEINFYTTLGKNYSGWIEWSSYFVDGKLKELHLINYRPPDGKEIC